MKFQVSQDSFSVARGGDLVAEKLADTGAEVVRTGSYGLAWLEPMVNVQTNSGTLSFGPVFPQELIEISLQETNYWSSSHPAYIGTLDSFDFYKRQHRLVFDQCGTAAPH
ncbi:MAG: formate dehydrogenase, partial [Gammaproteobacteria bacterium]|nr:formate dehydrogenase [Gammaproteobacteria bacterium]